MELPNNHSLCEKDFLMVVSSNRTSQGSHVSGQVLFKIKNSGMFFGEKPYSFQKTLVTEISPETFTLSTL
jgi:hypothetical protein